MKKIFDQNTTLHKILTYGVAFVVLALLFVFCEGEADPAWGWLIVGFLFYYALISRRILETLVIACAIGVILMYGNVSFVDGMVEQLYIIMEYEDYVWLILNCALFNIFMKLLAKTGAVQSLTKFAKKFAKDRKSVNVVTWLMQFPLFFDDFLHIIVLGQTMTPIYDEVDAPREDEGFLIQTAGEPVRVLIPFSGWLPFMTGLFLIDGIADNASDAYTAFVKTIPFNFYCWVAMIGSLLFALDLIPKFNGNKNPDKSVYKTLNEIEEDTAEAVEEDGQPKKKTGTLFDFILALATVIALSYYYDWDLIPACVIAIPVFVAYFLIRGLISPKDVEESMVEGTAGLVDMYILILLSYILAGVLEEMGFIDYLVEIAQNVANPHLLPFAAFVIFCITEAAMSLNWSMLLITFPVLIPLSIGIGANPYLVAAALISAGAFGSNFCYICDFSAMVSSFIGLPTAYHARNCLTYSLIFGGISAVLFLIAGFIF